MGRASSCRPCRERLAGDDGPAPTEHHSRATGAGGGEGGALFDIGQSSRTERPSRPRGLAVRLRLHPVFPAFTRTAFISSPVPWPPTPSLLSSASEAFHAPNPNHCAICLVPVALLLCLWVHGASQITTASQLQLAGRAGLPDECLQTQVRQRQRLRLLRSRRCLSPLFAGARDAGLAVEARAKSPFQEHPPSAPLSPSSPLPFTALLAHLPGC